MALYELALALVLIWILASCSLILGGCISACALSSRQPQTQRIVLYGQQKSDLYIN
jgi:hypothetical protein